jgi:hypothetical protein
VVYYTTWAFGLIFTNVLIGLFLYAFRHSIIDSSGQPGLKGKMGRRGEEGEPGFCNFCLKEEKLKESNKFYMEAPEISNQQAAVEAARLAADQAAPAPAPAADQAAPDQAAPDQAAADQAAADQAAADQAAADQVKHRDLLERSAKLKEVEALDAVMNIIMPP